MNAIKKTRSPAITGVTSLLGVVISLTFILSCTAQAATIEVHIQQGVGLHFDPFTANIHVGDTVTVGLGR